MNSGGAGRDRTADLLHAMQALSRNDCRKMPQFAALRKTGNPQKLGLLTAYHYFSTRRIPASCEAYKQGAKYTSLYTPNLRRHPDHKEASE
jgi:hypothetical protein